MHLFKGIPLKVKLRRMILLTVSVALLLFCLAVVVYEYNEEREKIVHELTGVTRIIGLNSIAALEFEDPKMGKEVLKVLETDERIVFAAIYRNNGEIFVSFKSDDTSEPVLPHPREEGVLFEEDHLLLLQSIHYKKEHLGSIFLQVDLTGLNEMLIKSGSFAIIMFAFLFFVSSLLSTKFISIIIEPIDRLQRAAGELGEGNMGVAVKVDSDDEIGRLTKAFNQMSTNLKETTVSKGYVDNILECMMSCLIVTNSKGKIKMVNQAVLDLLGYRLEEILEQPIDAILFEKNDDGARLENSAIEKIIARNSTGNLEMFALTKTKEEVSLLLASSTFNDFDHSKDGIIISAQDISERKVFEQELVLSKNESEKANKAKSEFLAKMSHELRTPMNAILGFTQLLMLNADGMASDLEKDNLKRILSAGDHLLELINDILDLSKIESGVFSLSVDSIDIAPILNEVVLLSKPLARKKNISIELRKTFDASCFVKADALRLKQVLLNLVSNAIKYNKENGSVVISCEQWEDGRVCLGIRDTGHGISTEMHERIFKPFERFDADAESIEGTGIGLTISKQLVEMMGGSIGFDSVWGEGSYFFIEFLAGNAVSDQIGAMIDANTMLDSVVKKAKSKILYVEDLPANVELVRQILSCRPHIALIIANNGNSGIEMARQHLPDLILMDIHMPEMDGLTAFKKLHEIEETRNIPVIALTADAMDSDVKKAMKMGFNSYITKPINISQFLSSIDRFS